jgi:TPR repeat protein
MHTYSARSSTYLGILLNQGKIEGVEENPELAVVWWRRCVDYHRHIWASFEMGVAFYTGEGVPENAALASRFFRQAAHFGHAGAAYVLGDMLLNGVGVERDRATALEWLVTAAELGHPLAQERVIIVIQQEYEALEKGDSIPENKDETLKWVNNPDNKRAREVQIERRYTIGGGTRNPVVLNRRKTIVKESLQDEGRSGSENVLPPELNES